METGNGTYLESFEKFLPKKNTSLANNERIMIQVACFMHRELAVRLAHRAFKLEETTEFKNSPHIQHVCNMYKVSFAMVRALAIPVDLAKERVFAKAIEEMYERHAATLINMAKGANELRMAMAKANQSVDDYFDYNCDIQRRLDEFYFSRIGRCGCIYAAIYPSVWLSACLSD